MRALFKSQQLHVRALSWPHLTSNAAANRSLLSPSLISVPHPLASGASIFRLASWRKDCDRASELAKASWAPRHHKGVC